MTCIRGGVKIENQENLGQCPNREGVKKRTEMSQFQFGNFENRGGGLYFSKMSLSLSQIFSIFYFDASPKFSGERLENF